MLYEVITCSGIVGNIAAADRQFSSVANTATEVGGVPRKVRVTSNCQMGTFRIVDTAALVIGVVVRENGAAHGQIAKVVDTATIAGIIVRAVVYRMPAGDGQARELGRYPGSDGQDTAGICSINRHAGTATIYFV